MVCSYRCEGILDILRKESLSGLGMFLCTGICWEGMDVVV